MQLSVDHRTRYDFDGPVFLEPHILRMVPASNHRQRLIDFELEILPQPVGLNKLVDPEGNICHQLWFENYTQVLDIHIRCTVEMMDYNPFGFLVYPLELSRVGFTYPDYNKLALDPYLSPLPISPGMRSYLDQALKDFGTDLIPFLTQLTNRLYHDFEQEFREVGNPLEPDETFELRKGSCRDLVWMLISMARSLGLAGRFVSGYLNSEDENELHAWAELYLMGGGWVGLDPTSGLAANEHHIWLAAGSNPGNTLPVAGSYRGSAASKLTTDLQIEPV